jgi:hypothetical protein
MLEISTDLPSLPRVLKKREAVITPKIESWFKHNWTKSYALEIKIKGNKLERHQNRDLMKVVNGKFSLKLSDATIGKLPFDVVGLIDADAIVATHNKETKVTHVQVLNTGKEFNITL